MQYLSKRIVLKYLCFLLTAVYLHGVLFVENDSQKIRTNHAVMSINFGMIGRQESFGNFLNQFSEKSTVTNDSKYVEDHSLKDFSAPLLIRLMPYMTKCSASLKNSSDMIMLIKSRPQEFSQRQTVRETWGTEFREKLAFVIGQPYSNSGLIPELDLAIQQESKQFRDILYVDFVDSYYNLSLKFVASLRFMSSECSPANFFAYGDSDTLVFPKNVKTFIRHIGSQQQTIYGELLRNNRVRRSGKW